MAEQDVHPMFHLEGNAAIFGGSFSIRGAHCKQTVWLVVSEVLQYLLVLMCFVHGLLQFLFNPLLIQGGV